MAPKIYHLHPLVAGPLTHWRNHLARCRDMGFDTVCVAPPFVTDRSGDIFATSDFDALHPALQWEGPSIDGIARAAEAAAALDLQFWLDLSFERDVTAERIIQQAAAGVTGFRCLKLASVQASAIRRTVETVRSALPELHLFAWTPGMARAALAGLESVGFDYVGSSLAWWDGRSPWLADESEALARIAPIIASTEPSFTERRTFRRSPLDEIPVSYRQALRIAAATANGIFVPMGFEYCTRRAFDTAHAQPTDFEQARDEAVCDLSGDIRAANETVDQVAALDLGRPIRMLTGTQDPVTILLRNDAAKVSQAARTMAILINPDTNHCATSELPLAPLPPMAGVAFGMPRPPADTNTKLAPGEVRTLMYSAVKPVIQPIAGTVGLDLPRIAIEALQPSVPGGEFAVKRVAGEMVAVTADIFADGHEILGADILWRAMDEDDWHRSPMRLRANDRWEASFTPVRVGQHQFTVEAWFDPWATFCHDLAAKHSAGQRVTVEIEEGMQLLHTTAARGVGCESTALRAVLHRLDVAADEAAHVSVLLSPEAREAMQSRGERRFTVQHEPPRRLRVDRPRAAFAGWYELFPRSVTNDEFHHGTFADVIERLPAIRAMGFDVLYFPPVHPIGTTNRKGRNNALQAQAGDVGSPYAIGGVEGGHDAIHPQLGTLEDFDTLVAAARANELEIALDFAIQCSPDHPWLREHPDWFRWRADGSIRFAENPPKRYEDIVNPDFYADAAMPALWLALRDVVQFWIDRGVRTFRVDNPHTKPLPFWQWMIADIQGRQPDAVFLSEAFTRPKMMYRLAKVGFSQSYTYFTWRNSKREIIEYITELNAAPVREFFRPNFFVNTPDINPPFLQTSGRAGFLIRAALACTLSGLWGMYSGFELCESAPLPGREEYLDSEKYQIRVRDFSAPGNIISEITTLNRIRRAHPALQSHLGTTFYNADNDQVIYYGRHSPLRREMILVAVNLNPHAAQETAIELPLWEFGLPDSGAFTATDLMRGNQFTWQGKNQRIRLDPAELPFSIWQVVPIGGAA